MTSATIHHNVQVLLDAIWNLGHTPAIFVSLRTGPDLLTGVPEFVLQRYVDLIALELSAEYPLDLEYEPEAMSVTLAFQGVVSRVRIPWSRITAVIDRESGSITTGTAAPLKVPPPGPSERGADVQRPVAPWTPRVIDGGKKDKPS